MQPNFSRPVFSPPGTGYQPRTSQSPATSDGLPPQYDGLSPSYPLPIPHGGSNHSNNYSQPSHHQHLPSHVLSSQAPVSHSLTPPTTAPTDNYSRGSATQSYMNTSSSTPQQQSYPSFTSTHASQQQPSPTSVTTAAVSRAIPAHSTHHSPMQAPPHYNSRQYNYQGLPSVMGGAVLSNMANPGGQMTIVGGGLHAMHPGYGHHLGPHHGMLHHGLQAPQQDRPFKCDECPQSFNRNHDLKRHKKIHLAVKPFPCGHCDKSFSRKDALKVCFCISFSSVLSSRLPLWHLPHRLTPTFPNVIHLTENSAIGWSKAAGMHKMHKMETRTTKTSRWKLMDRHPRGEPLRRRRREDDSTHDVRHLQRLKVLSVLRVKPFFLRIYTTIH